MRMPVMAIAGTGKRALLVMRVRVAFRVMVFVPVVGIGWTVLVRHDKFQMISRRRIHRGLRHGVDHFNGDMR